MTLPPLSFFRTQTYKMSVRCVPQMCCLETKHNSSPSDRRLENKESGEGGGGCMNLQKTQRRSTVNKASSVYSAFKDSGIPHHTPALPLRGIN